MLLLLLLLPPPPVLPLKKRGVEALDSVRLLLRATARVRELAAKNCPDL